MTKNLATFHDLDQIALHVAAASGKPIAVPRAAVAPAEPVLDALRALADRVADSASGRDAWTARALARHLVGGDVAIVISAGTVEKYVADPGRSLRDVIGEALSEATRLDGVSPVAVVVKVQPKVIGG